MVLNRGIEIATGIEPDSLSTLYFWLNVRDNLPCQSWCRVCPAAALNFTSDLGTCCVFSWSVHISVFCANLCQILFLYTDILTGLFCSVRLIGVSAFHRQACFQKAFESPQILIFEFYVISFTKSNNILSNK